MRIGIATQPLTSNYGGILQNYALQTVLKRMGHEVWTMDYNKFTWLDWLDNAWRVIAHKLLGHDVRFSKTPPARQAMERPLRRFALKNISLTVPRTKYVERRIAKKYGFEAIVVGSDQVWRPQYNRQIDRMFLSFCQDMDIRRIAYAASFGTDEWEFTPKQTRVCAPLSQRFDAISVREASGVKLCRDYLRMESTHVLDPTLLLTAEDYTRLCTEIPYRGPFVFAYILDQSEEKIKEIKSFADREGLPYLIQSAGPNVQEDDSVELWISRFRDAAYVITDSFHGTAFSINFEKEFYVYGNPNRGNSRFDSLLGLFDLKNRIVDKNITKMEKIDWEKVEFMLVSERDKSQNFIKVNMNRGG